MSVDKLITLEAWAALRYGESAPNIQTLRRWARDAKIVPAPRKHGRSYFVYENAEYLALDDARRSSRLIHAINVAKTSQQ